MHLEGLPHPLTPFPDRSAWSYAREILVGQAPALSDLFTDPLGKPAVANAPWLTFDSTSNGQLSCFTQVDFAATFDAGVLLVYQDAHHWAKFCYEYSPRGRASLVSVVTRGTSDDCNSLEVPPSGVWMRLSQIGPAFAFHHSPDQLSWELIRVFSLANLPTQLGFLVQSPTGTGSRAQFSQIQYRPHTLTNLRDGT